MKIKNYIILFIIYLVTILLVLYSVALYKKSSDLINYGSSINTVIKEISEDNYFDIYSNINNYIMENHSFILYISFFSDDIVGYENELQKFIIDNDAEDIFLYVNVDDIKKVSDLDTLFKDFSDIEISYNISKKTVPLFIYFKDGKINTIIDSSDYDFDRARKKIVDLGVIDW